MEAVFSMSKILSNPIHSWMQRIDNLEQNGLPDNFWAIIKENKIDEVKFEISFSEADIIKKSGINPTKFEKIKKLQSLDNMTLVGFFESKGCIKQIKD